MSTTRQKIKAAVAKALPPQQSFTILSEKTGIGESQVLRVITPAWRKLDKVERVMRIQKSVAASLDDTELKDIFRFSVLTPEEWKHVKPALSGGASKVIARKKAARSS